VGTESEPDSRRKADENADEEANKSKRPRLVQDAPEQELAAQAPPPAEQPPAPRSALRKRAASKPVGGDARRPHFSNVVDVVVAQPMRHLRDELWTKGLDKVCEDCGREVRGKVVVAGAPGRPRLAQTSVWCQRCAGTKAERARKDEEDERQAKQLAEAGRLSRESCGTVWRDSDEAQSSSAPGPTPAQRAEEAAATPGRAFLRERRLDSQLGGSAASRDEVQEALNQARREQRARAQLGAQNKRQRRGR